MQISKTILSMALLIPLLIPSLSFGQCDVNNGMVVSVPSVLTDRNGFTLGGNPLKEGQLVSVVGTNKDGAYVDVWTISSGYLPLSALKNISHDTPNDKLFTSPMPMSSFVGISTGVSWFYTRSGMKTKSYIISGDIFVATSGDLNGFTPIEFISSNGKQWDVLIKSNMISEI